MRSYIMSTLYRGPVSASTVGLNPTFTGTLTGPTITTSGAITAGTNLTVTGSGTLGSLLVNGTSTLTGNVGIGASGNTGTSLIVVSASLVGADQTGINSRTTFGSDATSSGVAIAGYVRTAAAAYTMASGTALLANTPILGAGSAITTQRGVFVVNQGAAGITNAYGVYINPQSGAATTNIGLYNGGTTHLADSVGIGGASVGGSALYVIGTTTLAGTLNVYAAAGDAQFYVNRAAASYGNLWFQTAGVNRWRISVNSVAESGANAGSNLEIVARDDVGGSIGTALSITRSTMAAIFSGSLAVTGTSTLTGNVGIGTASATNIGLQVASAALSGATTQNGIAVTATAGSGATTAYRGIAVAVFTAAAAYTVIDAFAFRAETPTLGAGSAITNSYGYYAANQGASGVANAYGVYISAQSGAATINIGLYNAGTSLFAGNVGFNGTSPIAKPTVTGSRAANAALASLITALANYGLVTDSSTA